MHKRTKLAATLAATLTAGAAGAGCTDAPAGSVARESCLVSVVEYSMNHCAANAPADVTLSVAYLARVAVRNAAALPVAIEWNAHGYQTAIEPTPASCAGWRAEYKRYLETLTDDKPNR